MSSMNLRARYSALALLVFTALPSYAFADSCICISCLFNRDLENFIAVGEAMSPTFETGDCALMRHMKPREEDIEPGTVIGFEPQIGDPIRVFRVVGKPGDRIALRNGQLVLNGQQVLRDYLGKSEIVFPDVAPFPRCESVTKPGEVCARSWFKETLPNGASYEVLDIGETRGDFMMEVVVPPRHFFVLGDHRDNANDSRFPKAKGGQGLVSLQSIVGVFEGL